MAYLGNQPVVGDSANTFKLLDDISSFTLTFDGSSASVVSVANNTLTFANHRFVTGQRVTYTDGGGTAITGLTDATAYFIIKVDQSTIKLATNASNAASSTAIDLTGLGAGTSHTLKVAFDGVNTKFKATHTSGIKSKISRAAQISLSINGVIQQPQDTSSPTVGYGVEADSTIVFSTAPVATDKVFGSFIGEVAPSFDLTDNTVDNFTGDGSTTTFTLSRETPSSQDVLVTLDGVTQHPSDASTTRSYSVVNQGLTFTSAPANGVAIQARHIGFAGATTSEVTGFYGRTGNVALTSTDDISVSNVSAGIITATTFGGNPSFTGSVSIGGTLTYEDVTNIDSVGLITARNGIVVGSGITLSKDGDIFATGISTAEHFHSTDDLIVDDQISAGGKFLLGHTSSRTVGDRTHLIQIEGTALQDGGLSMVRNRDDEHSTSITLAKTRGSSTGANTIVQSGDSIGEFAFAAGDGTDVVTRAGRIHCEIDGTPGANDMPGRLILSTTADGGSSPTERVRITSTGLVGIGTNTPSELVDALKSGNDAIIKTRTAGAGAYFEADSAATEGYYGLKLSTNGTERWFVGSYNKNDFQIKDGSGASGTTMLTIADSTGNTGLGTDNPLSRLHLAGRLSVHHSAVDTEGEFLRIGRTDLPLIRYHSIKAKHGGATANNYITFNLHNTSDTTSQLEVLRLRGDGMVGIDINSPDTKLTVKGASVGGTANDQSDTLKLINYSNNTNQLIFGTKRLSNGSDWQTTCERIQRRIDVTKMGYIDFGRVNDGYKMVIGNESQGDVLECKADGDVVVTNGDVVFAAGHGINFSQNANHAQANNELLDDYEEGTFTPSFKAGNNSSNASTTVNEAQYTKIGNVVYFRLYIQLAAHAAGTTGGDAFIVDLPFTNISGHAAVSVSYWANWAANQMFVAATVQPSAAHLLFRHNISVSSASANMDYDNNLQVGSAVIVSGCYITTAA